MTGTTSRGYPYPQITDTIDGLAGYIQSLAQAVNDDVAASVTHHAGRLVAQANQSLAHNTAVALQFPAGSEEIMTDAWHSVSVNNTRFTPLIAGYYDVWGAVAFANGTDYVTMQAWIRKNGITALAPAGKPILSATQIGSTTMVPVPLLTVQMNGTTDYLEIVAQHTNGAATARNAVVSFQFASTFELKLRART